MPDNHTQEKWYALANDPALHTAGVEVGAWASFNAVMVPRLRIVFRKGTRKAGVSCTRVVAYNGPLESLPSEVELARSTERLPMHLTPEKISLP